MLWYSEGVHITKRKAEDRIMAKKIAIIVVVSLLNIFLIIAIVKYLDSAPQLGQDTSDPAASTTTEPMTTAPLESTDPDTTLPETSATQETEHTEEGTAPTQVTTQDKTEDPVAATVATQAPTQPTVQEELPMWKTLYKNYATVKRNEYTHFALVYIDDDDIPELYMYGNGKSHVGAARGNAMIGKNFDSVGGGNYQEKSGKFLNVSVEGNMLVMRVYQLSDAFYEIFYGREDKSVDPPAYYILNYTIPVDEETFKAEVAKYMDTTQTKFLHENALGYDAFVEQLINH